MNKIDKKIAIIGLGYVGLPLAIEFSKKYKVIGFDINENRIHELSSGFDRTHEANLVDLNHSLSLSNQQDEVGLLFSNKISDINQCNIFIITVPTPINKFKSPDLTPLLKASEMVGSILKKGDLVIYESTVYPGCTEDDCVPVLEKKSSLKFNLDFFCGYSHQV